MKKDLKFMVKTQKDSGKTYQFDQILLLKKKMKLLISAANEFSENYKKDLNTRFDVITVLPDEKNKLQVTHIINAFESIDGN